MSDGREDSRKGFSLSFGANSFKHRQTRVKIDEEDKKPKHEYVTGFTESGLTFRDADRTTTSVEGTTQKIIPNLGNDLRGLGPKAYNPNRFLPQKDDIQKVEDGDGRFEVAAPEEKAEVKYGLMTFGKEDATGSAQENSGAQENGSRASKRGRQVVGSGQDWETEAYKNDIDSLPNQASLEEYEAMPVEAFGAAMLRGMGWCKENDTVKAQAKEFVRRAPLLGLGATAAPQPQREKRFIKPGESREAKRDMVVYDKDGNIKHTRTADDKLVERVVKGPSVGKTMRILSGRHSGLLCTVTAIHPEVGGHSQKADVRLVSSEEVVSVRLKVLGERDERPKETKQNHGDHRSKEPAALDRRKEEAFDNREPLGVEQSWLAPHIRVKVIDKSLGKGRLYLKKGEVTDVLMPTLCSVSLDTGEQIEAQQRQLETVIPKKEGARLLVVSGPMRGKRAKLLKRSSESSQAAVQLTEDFSVQKVSFDEISEYVGDLGDKE